MHLISCHHIMVEPAKL